MTLPISAPYTAPNGFSIPKTKMRGHRIAGSNYQQDPSLPTAPVARTSRQDSTNTSSSFGSPATAEAGQSAVHFDPPLWLQRQEWLVKTLRSHDVKTVLDVGCGEGKLLAALARPPLYKGRFPIERFARLAEQYADIEQAALQKRLVEAAATAVSSSSSSASGDGTTSFGSSFEHRGLAMSLSDAFSAAASPPFQQQQQQGEDDSHRLPTTHWIFSSDELSPHTLVGLDLSEEDLHQAQREIQSVLDQAEKDAEEIRWDSLTVSLLRGNLAQFHEKLVAYDAIVATEV